MNSDRSNWIKLRQSDPIIINSHLRRSWRCNASAERHLFHSVHHWTKEVNFTIERIISVSVHHCNLLSGVSSMISADELTSLVERAVGCLLPKSIFAFAEVILASLSPSSCRLTGVLAFLAECTSAIIISSLRGLLETKTLCSMVDLVLRMLCDLV